MKPASKIIKQPRITEKASMLSSKNVYTFDVYPGVTKTDIKKAIREIYKIEPVKVRMIVVPGKKVFVRGRTGMKKGGRKALVYLKAGDKIEFI